MKIANILTISRILLIFLTLGFASVSSTLYPAVYPIFDLSESFVRTCHIIALLLAGLAAMTDFFDGYLARKLNQISDFGTLMDPLADKVFVTTMFLILVYYDYIPAWIAVIILSREFLVTGLRSLAAKKGIIMAADRWGKWKTFLQMMVIFIGGMAWVGWFPANVDLLTPTKDFDLYRLVWHASLWGVTIITVISGFGYFIKYKDLYCKDW